MQWCHFSSNEVAQQNTPFISSSSSHPPRPLRPLPVKLHNPLWPQQKRGCPLCSFFFSFFNGVTVLASSPWSSTGSLVRKQTGLIQVLMRVSVQYCLLVSLYLTNIGPHMYLCCEFLWAWFTQCTEPKSVLFSSERTGSISCFHWSHLSYWISRIK